MRPKEEREPPQACAYMLVFIAAAMLGFLSFNFYSILKVSHVHISIAHAHKTTAFCAFIGCKIDMQDAAKPLVTVTHEQQEAVDPAVAKTTAILSTRVCGSPAVDGYAHVVPKCLEGSPTAVWWAEYYASGGKQSDLVSHIEVGADYDGLAVVWGIGNNKTSPEECAEHCRRHMPHVVQGPFVNLPCNAWAYCADDVCWEPDAHKHHRGDCWLKFTEGPAAPEVNMRGRVSPEARARHPNAPDRVQWVSGVLLPKGVPLSNGTWSPRYKW